MGVGMDWSLDWQPGSEVRWSSHGQFWYKVLAMGLGPRNLLYI